MGKETECSNNAIFSEIAIKSFSFRDIFDFLSVRDCNRVISNMGAVVEHISALYSTQLHDMPEHLCYLNMSCMDCVQLGVVLCYLHRFIRFKMISWVTL